MHPAKPYAKNGQIIIPSWLWNKSSEPSVLAGISKQPWLTCIQQHKKYDSLRLYKTRNTKENILYAIFLTTFRTCLLCSQAALTGAVGVPRRLILGAWGCHPCLATELPGKLWTKQAVTAQVLCGGLKAYPGYGSLVAYTPKNDQLGSNKQSNT